MNTPYPMQSKEYIHKKTANHPYLLRPATAIQKIKEELTPEQYKEKAATAFLKYYAYQFHEHLKTRTATPMTLFDIATHISGIGRSTNCLFRWEQYRQVYSFNKELLDIVTNADNDTVPVDIILQKLPFDCFFIQNEFEYSDTECENFVGVYVVDEINPDKQHTLVFSFLHDDLYNITSFYFPLDNSKNATIKDLLMKNDFLKRENSDVQAEYFDTITKNYNTLKQTLNCVLYLCSDKVDVVRTKQEYKSTDAKDKNKRPKKVNVDLVGNEVAKVIRENKARYKYVDDTNNDTDVSVSAHKGKEKSPHFRKAHFHAFWVGAHDSPDRHLEVKLLSPILVKGGGNKDVTTIRKISLPKALKQTENDVFEINEQDEDEELDLTGNKNRGL